MKITKLNWAGLLVEVKDTTILIDPLGDTSENMGKPNVAQFGTPREELIQLTDLPRPESILITHPHSDHFSFTTLLSTYGTDLAIYLPAESVPIAEKAGFTNVKGISLGESITIGEITITASYAVDGFGSPQVSWVIEGEGNKILHGGDTLWHGYWWKMSSQHGPFQAVFLPINGARLEIPGLPKQTSLPACMNPEEAVEAAYLLGAELLVPIHYHTFHHPPYYLETEHALERLARRAEERGVVTKALQPNEQLTFE